MANEALYKIGYTLNNGDLDESDSFSFRDDQANELVEAGVQTVGFATHELLDLGDVADAGICVFRNIDPTNFVEIGRVIAAAFEPFTKIRPGKAAVIEPADTVTWYVKANTAAVGLKKYIPSL